MRENFKLDNYLRSYFDLNAIWHLRNFIIFTRFISTSSIRFQKLLGGFSRNLFMQIANFVLLNMINL